MSPGDLSPLIHRAVNGKPPAPSLLRLSLLALFFAFAGFLFAFAVGALVHAGRIVAAVVLLAAWFVVASVAITVVLQRHVREMQRSAVREACNGIADAIADNGGALRATTIARQIRGDTWRALDDYMYPDVQG
jgi:hypothetical protein